MRSTKEQKPVIIFIIFVVIFLGIVFIPRSVYEKIYNAPFLQGFITYFSPSLATPAHVEVIAETTPTPTILPSPTPTPTAKPKPKPSPSPSPKPSPSPAFIQVKGESFSGRYGDPIPGVRITLRNLSSGATAVYSNPGPKWTMSGLEPGTYQFRFDRVEGFTMKHQLCYESCGAGWISTWAEGDEISAEINNKRPVLINLVYKKK